MSDLLGMMAAIRDDPDDDLPRLAHADWLEERGEVARATFIRTQIARACLDEYDDGQAELQAAERRLLIEHGPDWLPPEIRMEQVRFRRGFVEEIRCDLGTLRRWLPLVEGWPVRRLEVWETDGQEDVGWLRGDRWLSGIESLSLRRWHAPWRAILGSPHLTRLRELHVEGENYRDLAGVLASTGHAANLEALGMEEMWGVGRSALVVLPWPRLRRVHFSHDEDTPRMLLESEFWGRLETIELDASFLNDKPALTAALGRMQAHRLSVSDRSFGADMLGVIAEAPAWGRLCDLRIGRTNGESASLAKLLRHPDAALLSRLHLSKWVSLQRAERDCPSLPALRWLECANNDAFEILHHLPRLVGLRGGASGSWAGYLRSRAATHLRWLRLDSGLNNPGAEAVANSAHLGSLTTLITGSNRHQFRRRTARAIAEAPGLPCLSFIALDNTSPAACELVRGQRLAWVGLTGCDPGEQFAALSRSRYRGIDWGRCFDA